MLNKNKNNSICAICGNEYEMCYSCKDAKKAAHWKLHCDTSEHYKVYQIVNGYTSGVYTKNEALDRIKNVDVSDRDAFRPHIKSIVEDILSGDKGEDKSIESDIDGNTPDASEVQQSDVHAHTGKTTRRSRKVSD